ncbi:MAG: MBL fold metallo-hydrolase [Limisphaerales bacterium]
MFSFAPFTLKGRVRRGVGGKFQNLHQHKRHGLLQVLKWKFLGRNHAIPQPYNMEVVLAEVESGLENHVTWIGHSSFVLFLNGRRYLIDPVFSDYCAPLRSARFRRRAPPGVDWGALGPIDGVFISHNHYDHLDKATILRMPADTLYLVPLGLERWFEKLGRRNVRELDWWASTEFAGVKASCVPAQHFSSRTLWDRDRTLWCGWIIESEGVKVYYAGDTGYCPVFAEIGARYGPIDLAMIPIGAYEPRWFMKPMHVNPDEAVQIHLNVRARKSVACHWGTFCLTDEPMGEPPERLRAALRTAGVGEDNFVIPPIGGSVSI